MIKHLLSACCIHRWHYTRVWAGRVHASVLKGVEILPLVQVVGEHGGGASMEAHEPFSPAVTCLSPPADQIYSVILSDTVPVCPGLSSDAANLLYKRPDCKYSLEMGAFAQLGSVEGARWLPSMGLARCPHPLQSSSSRDLIAGLFVAVLGVQEGHTGLSTGELN